MAFYDLNMNNKRIINTQDPSNNQDVAIKSYVDLNQANVLFSTGNSTPTIEGKAYYLDASANWILADYNNSAKKIVALARGTTSDGSGMWIGSNENDISLNIPGDIGSVLFLDLSGNLTTTKPSIANKLIRPVGYKLNDNYIKYILSFNLSFTIIFPGGTQSTSDLYTLMNSMTGTDDTTPTAGGTLTLNSVLIGNYDYTIKSGNQSVTSFNDSDWFTSTQDSAAALIFVDGDLTINTGQTLIPAVRKLFTCIFVNGNLTVLGGISMTGRGASTGSLNVQTANIRIINGKYSSVINPQVPSGGGNGGSGISSTGNGNAGGSGSSGGAGGGGGGGAYLPVPSSGSGSQGSSFSGGSGGGGANGNGGGGNMNASSFGGAGGIGRNVQGGNTSAGGTGNPGGASIRSDGFVNADATGTNGTGGTLIIFSTGSLLGNGTISANGVNGLNIFPDTNLIGPAGASGGGSLTIICNSDNSTITRTANGGAGGVAIPNNASFNQVGGAGGNGTSRTLTGF